MPTVSLNKMIEKLELKNLTPEVSTEGIEISSPDINRPALQLAGYFEHFACERVQIIGYVEYTYLKSQNREENLKLSDAAVQLMIRAFEEFAKLEKSLILEANFHKRELQQLQDIAKTYDYEVMTLVLEADLHILHERYMNRMKNCCKRLTVL